MNKIYLDVASLLCYYLIKDENVNPETSMPVYFTYINTKKLFVDFDLIKKLSMLRSVCGAFRNAIDNLLFRECCKKSRYQLKK